MRVVKARVQRVGRQGRRVVLVQLEQRRSEIGPTGLCAGIRIGLELVAARQHREQRRHEEREHRNDQQEEKQRECVVGRGHRRLHTERRVEPCLLRQPAEQREACEAEREHRDQTLGHVFVFEVAEFMRQHGLDFAGRKFVQQSVEEHHPLGRAEAGEVGIGMGRAFAAVHHEQAFGLKAAARHQTLHARLQGLVGERLELVEQGRDDGRVEHQHKQVEDHPRAPGPEPPQGAGGAHQPQHQRGNRQADQRTDQRALEHVGEVQLPRHPVEAEALFDAEGAVQLERQIERAADHDKGRQQRELVGHVAQPRLNRATHPCVKCTEPAEQRPAEQHRRAERHHQQTEAALDEGVVGRLLVPGQAHVRREARGHGAAVGRDIPHLTRRQPEFDKQRHSQRDGEQQGEGQSLHGTQV